MSSRSQAMRASLLRASSHIFRVYIASLTSQADRYGITYRCMLAFFSLFCFFFCLSPSPYAQNHINITKQNKRKEKEKSHSFYPRLLPVLQSTAGTFKFSFSTSSPSSTPCPFVFKLSPFAVLIPSGIIRLLAYSRLACAQN